MPPKAKFTREQIIAVAFEIVKKRGIDALTARSLAEELGSSPRPVFTVFESMDEVQQKVKATAKKLYESYEDEAMACDNPFKGSGVGYVRFAKCEPQLFRLLFMSEQTVELNLSNVLGRIDDYSEKILSSVQTEYGFGRETSAEIYLHLWIYTHGIASLIATGVCSFSDEEISHMLYAVGSGIVQKFKREGRK